MSAQFWWGMATVPIAAAVLTALYWIFLAAVEATARWGQCKWKKWHGYHDNCGIAAVVANAPWVRTVLFMPGFYFVIARFPRLADQQEYERTRHYPMVSAIRTARQGFDHEDAP